MSEPEGGGAAWTEERATSGEGRQRLESAPQASGKQTACAALDGAKLVQLEIPDLDGGLRAKLVSVPKALSPAGAAMCTIMFGLTLADDVYESPASSAANGYPDLVLRPDLATLRRLPWCEATAAVLCDLFGADGAPFPVAPRTVLQAVAGRCAELGYEARFAAEWELCVVHRDDSLTAGGRAGELAPLGRTMNAYSSLRLRELRPLALAFFQRMEAVGIPVESVHTELGHGMVEFALAHAPALEAADHAARAKAYFKELCGERDLVATFMPKWRTGAPTSGCHFHQSLWRDGANVFAGRRGGLSPLARHYLAGQLATMPDFSVLFNPSVNAYRRLQPGNFTPATASWGTDNRTAAIRAITGPAKGARLEHRRPGADVSPYLAIAAMLAGGLHGITEELEPPAPATADAYADGRFPRLPATLAEAIGALRGSPVAAGLLGPEFAGHYLLSREVELRLWREWESEQVTEWEHRRYFESS
jgi:glutamine synthetase